MIDWLVNQKIHGIYLVIAFAVGSAAYTWASDQHKQKADKEDVQEIRKGQLESEARTIKRIILEVSSADDLTAGERAYLLELESDLEEIQRELDGS